MNPDCPRCRAAGTEVSRHGTYKRRSDSRHIQRFRCRSCARSFSRATGTADFAQKKRRINAPLRRLLASCVSLRRAASILKVSKNTVSRRLIYLGDQAQSEERRAMSALPPARRVQVDDLITLEHTKCKPLSVCVAVSADERLILGVGVAAIPASGHLAAISRAKYGQRKDESRPMRRELFEELVDRVDPAARFESDGLDQYATLVRRQFPDVQHVVHPSIKGCVTGQGELKKAVRDPLFAINHTLAMLRANINRLVRRTWCTTKQVHCLVAHLWIYIRYHNEVIRQRSRDCTQPATSV